MTPPQRFALSFLLYGMSLSDAYRAAFPNKQLSPKSLAVAASQYKNSHEVSEAIRLMRDVASGKAIKVAADILDSIDRDFLGPLRSEFVADDAQIDGMDEMELRARLRVELRRSAGMVKQLSENDKKPWFRAALSDYEKLAQIAQRTAQAIEANRNNTIIVNMPLVGEGVDGRKRHRQEFAVIADEWRFNPEDGSRIHWPSFTKGQSASSAKGGLQCSESPKFGQSPDVCFCRWQSEGRDDSGGMAGA